jgi:hypothetical protein
MSSMPSKSPEGTLKQISDSSALIMSREEPIFNLNDLFKKEKSKKAKNLPEAAQTTLVHFIYLV